MKRTLSLVIVVITFSVCLFAQPKQDKYLVDAFGQLNLDDLMARLDMVAVNLYAPSENKLVVRIARNNGEIFDSPFLMGGTISSYLIKNRGLDTSKFRIEYCNLQGEKLKTQLFVLPQGKTFARCNSTIETPKKATLFARTNPYTDGFTLEAVEETVPEIGFESGNYSSESLRILKQFLNNSEESKLYIVTSLGRTYGDDKGNGNRKVNRKAEHRKMRKTVEEVLRKSSINFSQVEFIETENFNGYQKYEFWFVPEGGKIPKPKPNYSPSKKKRKPPKMFR